MSFLLKPMLASLLLVPVLICCYGLLAKRRTKRAEDLAAKGFKPTAAALRLRKRRHVPFVFFFSGLTVLLFSLARPATSISVPSREGTVILAFDVSNSMRADDLKPTRLDAAKAAAKSFVAKQPESIKIGVVAFSDGGVVTQQPTKEKALVTDAIERLSAQGGTSLGQGIFTSLGAIAGEPLAIDPATLSEGPDGPTVDIGYFGSAAVILLSDGENTGDPPPADVAKLASVAGVKVHTIGIGNSAGTVLEIDGFSVSTALDEAGLQEISKVSDGTYYSADSSAQLSSVYESIDLEWTSVKRLSEITGLLAAGSIVLLLIGSALSLIWFGRVV